VLTVFLAVAAAPAQTPPTTPPARTDLSGDPLPAGALARLGTVRLRHDSYWWVSCALSPDETLLATVAAGDTGIRVWDAAGGAELFRLPGHDANNVLGAVFTPDGKTLLTWGHDATVRLWDVKGRRERLRFIGHKGGVFAAAVAPDGKTVASASAHESILLWEADSARVLRQLDAPKHDPYALAFSPDGKILASAGADQTVRLWDPATGQVLQTLAGHNSPVNSLTFAADGKTLASGSWDGTIRLWDLAAGKVRRVLEVAPRGRAPRAAFSPDGTKVATAHDDPSLRVWDAATGKEVRTIHQPSQHFLDVRFSRDGKMLIAAGHGTVTFWDPATGQELRPHPGHHGAVNGLAFSPGGHLVASAGEDRTLRLWDPATGKLLANLEGPLEVVQALAFTPDGQQVACASAQFDGKIYFWDLKKRKWRTVLAGGRQGGLLAIAPDGRTLACSSYGNDLTVLLVDVTGGKVRAKLEWHPQAARAAAFAPDGTLVATGGGKAEEGYIDLWDAETGASRQHWAMAQAIEYLAFLPDGASLVAVTEAGRLLVLDVATGQERLSAGGPGRGLAAVSADGKLAALVAADESVQLWELATGKKFHALPTAGDRLRCLAFAPDGARLATVGKVPAPLVWDVAPGGGPAAGPAAAADLERWWTALASPDAVVGQQAVAALAARPAQATALLGQRLPVAATPSERRFKRLVADLDDPHFRVREAAMATLKNYGRAAEPLLRQALQKPLSEEVRARVLVLLAALGPADPFVLSGDKLRMFRGIQVLERVGDEQARAVLEGLAQASSLAGTPRDARLALERLAQRSKAAPW
jgi:WD40 repeat protein